MSSAVMLSPTPSPPRPTSPREALERGVWWLSSQAGASDGRLEGEVVWGGMLPAQWALAHHALGRPLEPGRRGRLVLQLQRSQGRDGLWGLHGDVGAAPSLYATSLAYCAARICGVPAAAPWLRPSRAFIRREGLLGVPSWGKLWLSVLGVYRWEGLEPLVPEVFRLPSVLPLAPERFYCHTRRILVAMSLLWAARFTGPETACIRALRRELWPQGFERVPFPEGRTALRAEDVVMPPSRALKVLQLGARLVERLHVAGPRAALCAELRGLVRAELADTAFASLSPVSGLLNVLALHAADPGDPAIDAALEALERWVWEDDVDGFRVAGARSATWDSAFAAQALTEAAHALGTDSAAGRLAAQTARRAASFVRSQQMAPRDPGGAGDRLERAGGFPFGDAWHGWPVSDCTAEALLALEAATTLGAVKDAAAWRRAAAFVLRCHNADGGFGSYEAQRGRVGLEWMNPAEMFADSMTERSYAECTASALSALGAAMPVLEGAAKRRATEAVAAGTRRLRRLQGRDGSWPGVWGVGHVYGTWFGARGLRAGGAATSDPALRRAEAFLLGAQRADGAWGEAPESCVLRRSVPAAAGSATQTAWGLLALVELSSRRVDARARAAAWLARRQGPDGDWPEEPWTGVFFRTALLDYRLYRRTFPVWALAVHLRGAST